MAYIQKVTRKKDVVYRAYIKKAGVKRVSKTFKTKRLDVQFVNSIESDRARFVSYNDTKPQTRLSVVIDNYLSKEYKGSRPKDEERKLNLWIENTAALCPNCHRKMHSLGLKPDIEKLTK